MNVVIIVHGTSALTPDQHAQLIKILATRFPKQPEVINIDTLEVRTSTTDHATLFRYVEELTVQLALTVSPDLWIAIGSNEVQG